MSNAIPLPAAWVCLILCLAGCAAPPTTNFYALSGIEVYQQIQPDTQKEVALRVGPFGFPRYLQRPNIVTRSAGNQLEVAEFHRWAGSLEDDFHQALGANLGILLSSKRISVYPADIRFTPDFLLTGDVITFDGELAAEVTLAVRWTIHRGTEQNALTVEHSVIREPVKGDGYPALIDAYQQAVLRFSQQIEGKIESLLP
jgi:uncharacterized lipoprotein YmbA